MSELSELFFNRDIIQEVWPYLLTGLKTTGGLALMVVPLGLSGGLLLAWLQTTTTQRWLKRALQIYTDVFRALPPLVLLVLVYYGVPFMGWELPRLGAVAIAFLLHASSYYGEILRAGIESVARGQWEAARATGLSTHKAFAYVVLPQGLRNVLPELVSNSIEAIKLTSIASVIALPELLYNARQAQSITMNATPMVVAGVMYLAVLWPMVRMLSRLEHSRKEVH